MPKILLLATYAGCSCFLIADSQFSKLSERNSEDGSQGISIQVQDANSNKPLPIRVILTAEDQSHPDGSGRGVYRDGRFFAEGSFAAQVPAGKLQVQIHSGANFIPVSYTHLTLPTT